MNEFSFRTVTPYDLSLVICAFLAFSRVSLLRKFKIGACKLWYWRRLLIVPWTAGRPNQSILKEISPEYSLEELMLKMKLQYFGHLL